MPHSVEMPAPVNGTITFASAIMSPSRSTPLRRSDALMQGFARGCNLGVTNLKSARRQAGLQRRAGHGRPDMRTRAPDLASGRVTSEGNADYFLARPRFFAGLAIRK